MRAVLAKHEAARVCMFIHAKKAEAMNIKIGRSATKFDMPKKIAISTRNLGIALPD